MRISLEAGLAIGWTINSFTAGQRVACFAIKATYQLQHGKDPILADEPEPLSGDKYTNDDTAKNLIYSTDFAPLKPRADVLVLATAYAPDQQPVRRLLVRIKVGPVDKTLSILGPRAWLRELSGRFSATEPLPFLSVPISYENAFGGPRSKANPIGRGVDSDDLPQIEDPRRFVASPSETIDPAGFGPLAASWQSRAALVGTYDEAWLNHRWPWFPQNFDYGYFNAAPLDQQVRGFLSGDEELAFGNLHPTHNVYRSRLPGRRARCFLQEHGKSGRPHFREVPLNLDTLWVVLDAESMVLVWRGHVPVRTVALKEVDQILAWTEPLSESPRPVSYCDTFLADHQRARDADLEIPSADAVSGAEAEKAASDAEFERVFAEFDKEMAAADQELTDLAAPLEQQWAAEKAALIADGADPALLEPTLAPGSAADILRASIRDLQGRPEDAALLQAELADVERFDAEVAAMDKEFAAEFPDDLTRDDVLAAVARRESLAGKYLDKMNFAGQDLSGIDFREASFRTATLTGANLSGANLRGADLSDADLTGGDLTDASLDDADLNGANLSGAKLTGVSVNGTDLSGLTLAGSDFSGSSGRRPDFSGSDLARALFIGARLPGADFSKAKLEAADFRGAKIPRADFDAAEAAGINLEGADITGASASGGTDFTGANFSGAKAAGAVFGEAMLDRANFTRAVLVRAQFSDASLKEAVLDRADLSSAAFDGAVLHRAALTNANLIRAAFDQADLTEASLRGSNLYEAGFWETVMDGADFSYANLKGTTLA